MKNSTLIIIIFTISLMACRKTIEHPVGSFYTEPGINDESAYWTLVDRSIVNITCLEIYDDTLFLAGEKNSYKNLYYFYGSSIISFKGYKYSGVFSLQTINDKLWVGGSYLCEVYGQYYSSYPIYTYYNLMNVKDRQLDGLKFGQAGVDKINSIVSFEDNVIVAGDFVSGNNIYTSYIERISSNNNALGFDRGLSNIIHDMEVFNDELYVCGEEIISNGVYAIGKWNGYDWVDMNIASTGNGNYGYSLVTFNNQLYFAGSISANDKQVYVLSQDEKWDPVNEITSLGSNAPHLYTDSTYLYFFGDSVYLNGKNESNVLKYDGNSWTAVGDLKATVNDLERYYGKLCAATDEGLYLFYTYIE